MNAQTGLPRTSGSAVPNIQEVAAAAGVSKTTVSHVISGNRPVSAATRRKVERVMAEMGFEPNFFARAMQSKRSNSTALIVQDITNPFYPALARGLQEAVADEEHALLLFDAGAEGNLGPAFVRDIIRRRVDGVVAAAQLDPAELDRLERAGIPVVAVGSSIIRRPEVDWVSADDEAIGQEAARRLIARGCAKVAIIRGPLGTQPADARHAGWARALGEAGRPIDLVETAEWTTQGGAAAVERLLERAADLDAVFCSNDQIAIGVLNALRAKGVRVPEDIALVGVDDIDAAALVRPSLTTVRIPATEIGRAAGELLLQRMEQGPDAPKRQILVQHTLIARDSA